MCHVSNIDAGHALKVVQVVWYQVFIIVFFQSPSTKHWIPFQTYTAFNEELSSKSYIMNCHNGIIIACQPFPNALCLDYIALRYAPPALTCLNQPDGSNNWIICFRLNSMESLVWLLKHSMTWCHESQSVGIGVREITVYQCILCFHRKVKWPGQPANSLRIRHLASRCKHWSFSSLMVSTFTSYLSHCLKQYHLWIFHNIHNIIHA